MFSNIANINSFIRTQLNVFKNRYATLTIQFKYTKKFQELLMNTNISITHYSFVSTQLNCSKFCYVSLTIQLNIGRK